MLALTYTPGLSQKTEKQWHWLIKRGVCLCRWKKWSLVRAVGEETPRKPKSCTKPERTVPCAGGVGGGPLAACWGSASVSELSSLSPPPQELEAALHRDDVEFISDLIARLLQGCYQRRDITWVTPVLPLLAVEGLTSPGDVSYLLEHTWADYRPRCTVYSHVVLGPAFGCFCSWVFILLPFFSTLTNL